MVGLDQVIPIYDTTASPFGKLDWGRCTQKKLADKTTLYLHVFDWPQDGVLLVPGVKNQVQQAYLLAGQTSLEARRQDEGVIVSLPAQAPDPINSVVVLKVGGTLEINGSFCNDDLVVQLRPNDPSRLQVINNKNGDDGVVGDRGQCEGWSAFLCH